MERPPSKWPLIVALLVIALAVFVLLPWYLGSLERIAHKKAAKQLVIQNADVKSLQAMAEKNDPSAQLKLGQGYLKGGDGTERDYAEAYKWFTLASERGSKPAAGALDQLIPIMTPDQIAEGRRRVEEFVAQRGK